jgi:hypothetical protein
MKKVYLTIAMVFLSLGLSGCLVATVGECIIRDATSKPCN